MPARLSNRTGAEFARGQRLRVAVDLTRLDMAGSAVSPETMHIRFVQGLTRRAGEADFVLLVRPAAFSALATLDAANVRRVTVAEPTPLESFLSRSRARVARRLRRSRFGGRQAWLSGLGDAMPRLRRTLLTRLGAEVVFCPYTASGVIDPSVPLVVAVHDLQHLSHPYLLTSAERDARARSLEPTCREAARIVCSTSSVRDVARTSQWLPEERVLTIAPGRLLLEPLPPAVPSAIAAALAPHGLREHGFYLVVADFEPRQNHALLLTAAGMFRARYPDAEMHIVCVGTPGARLAELRVAVERIGLGAVVHFPGALASRERTALIQACRAVLVPSVYETLGEVVLQAMALGRPVLCSQLPALAELTGCAALRFDPRRPAELAAAFERIEHEPALLDRLAHRGPRQVATLDDPETVAQAYLTVLREAAFPVGAAGNVSRR